MVLSQILISCRLESKKNYKSCQIILRFEDKKLFEDIKFPLKIKEIHKTEKKNFININIFGYENKEKYLIYVSKNPLKKKHIDLLLIEEDKWHYVLIKDFNIFMYDNTPHSGRKYFCRYCLQTFIT